MSICASGASAARPGVPAAVVVDQLYVQSILPPGLAWLFPYLPWMQGLVIGDVGAFCALDPPPFTVPSATQIFNFITGGPINDYVTVNKFIQDVTKAYLWYSLCQCSSGATPSAPSAPGAPSNLPVVNPPGQTSLPSAGACAQYGPETEAIPSTESFKVFPSSRGAGSGTGFTTGFGPTAAIPAGAKSWRFSYTTAGIASGTPAGLFLNFWTGDFSGYISSPVFTNVAVPSSGQISGNVPAGALFADAGIGSAGTATTFSGTATLEWFCDSAAGGSPQTPCCPPDPVLMARVNQILDLVTLVQRQSVPFGYVLGAVHSGLSGAGGFSVSGILGAAIEITTLPSHLGREGTNPTQVFDAGWVTFATPDGYPTSNRLEHSAMLMLPARCGAYTEIEYDLAGGVVVTITEIEREV